MKTADEENASGSSSGRTVDIPVLVPQWHKDVLDERERLLETREAKFVAWETAKRRITEQVSSKRDR